MWRRFLILCLIALSLPLQAGLMIERAQRLAGKSGDVVVFLKFEPPQDFIDALDASVELRFKLQLRASSGDQIHFINLRFKRMLSRYELEMEGSKRYFRLKAELFDAFSALHLADAKEVQALRLQLDFSALPSALRLPAMLDREWWLDSDWIEVRDQSTVQERLP
jgi:hypothetical protein